MKKRLVWNDLKTNKLFAVSTCFFMALSAFLFALTCFLCMNLFGSIDTLMEKAETPDFLQMHTGTIQEENIIDFVEQNDKVESLQIAKFLNLENASIFLNGKSLADSTQDNGVCIQNKEFDYLLDMDNQIMMPEPGQMYVPVCYKKEYQLEVGEKVKIKNHEFVIAGFLRDSQMNSMMASSKRFLINEADYQQLLPYGQEEYLIEGLLTDGADVNAFLTEYTEKNLPSNGPVITKGLIKMLNALSDGMMIMVVFLISLLMLVISLLCVKYMLLTKLESDRTEIGMLKAVGISKKDIRQLYFIKYQILSMVGAVMGLVAAFGLRNPLQKGMQELYGAAQNTLLSFLAAIIGALITEGLILLSISATLKKTECITAVEALTGQKTDKKRRMFSARYLLLLFVIMAGTFLAVVPQNLYSTIASPKFVTYMGIGDSQIRLDIRQTDSIMERTMETNTLLSEDTQVMKYTSLQTKGYKAILSDESRCNLNVELGDHTVFPISYVEGKEPVGEDEIALSILCAEESGLKPGDSIRIVVGGKERELKVCGLYSDVTNGGKTAKATFTDEETPSMWSIFYITLQDHAVQENWMQSTEKKLQDHDISAKLVSIEQYTLATYGQTLQQIRMVSFIAGAISILVIIMVSFLFIRLDMAKKRNEISLYKAIGFTSHELQRNYAKKYLLFGCAGIVSGIILGNYLGEFIVSGLMHTMGAARVHFFIDAGMIFAVIPCIVIGAFCFAICMGVKEIKKMKTFECCMNRE